jgi:hypothetical protein
MQQESRRDPVNWDVTSQPVCEGSYIVSSNRRWIPRNRFDRELMESIHKKMIIISRVLVWSGSEGETVSGKAMSHAKTISATHTRPQKATLVHHRPKEKCIARKWMTFDSLAKPESLLDSADHFCLNLPCKACHDSGISVRGPTQPFTQNRSELFLSLLSAMRVRASRYKQ